MIAHEEAPQTPLQKKLARTGKVLGLAALGICGVIFALGLFQSIEPLEMFMISVSLAVAAIPEGLPAVVTIVLAMGGAADGGPAGHYPQAAGSGDLGQRQRHLLR